MTLKAWSSQQKPNDEIFFQNDAVSVCLLLNRRARTMRVVDFRAGPSEAKRQVVLAIAQREGIDKVFTVVERDEVATWAKLGFTREGSIPSFYKRSDAFLLGCAAAAAAPSSRAATALDEDAPNRSETRLVAAAPVAPVAAAAPTRAHETMERTLVAAKRVAKEALDVGLPAARIAGAGEADARKAVAVALRTGRALTAFEPFGRDVERRYFVATARGGFELFVSTERQACFGNAYLECLESPRTDAHRAATAAALAVLCEALLADGVVSCFSLAPSDDVALAAAYLKNGFRRTGLLSQHLVVGGRRKDAILWARKLANPVAD